CGWQYTSPGDISIMDESFLQYLQTSLDDLRESGLYKAERVMTSPQGAWVEAAGRRVINLCSNNYLGLADDPRLIKAAQQALEKYGFGLSSVRFICGTQTVH